MTENYSVTVIIPFFNAQHFIKDSLDKLAKQDFEKPFEIIMVDDASTDSGKEIIKNYKLKGLKLYSLQ